MNIKLLIRNYFFLLVLLTGCIGTDLVEQETMPARIAITTRADGIRVGDSYQFQAQYFDELGNIVDADVTWSSSDPAVISIDASGLAMANSEGSVTISAMANGAVDMVGVIAGENTTVPFTLSDATGELQLTFSEGFSTSNGPGLFVYLTNSASSTTGGVELAALQSNTGAQTYNVGNGVQLGTYDYVLIYCKPFGIAFGIGKFEE